MAYRIEKDFLGEKQIPADAYYGVQTLRGKENFYITGIPMSLEPNFVKGFGYVKKAAALANRDLGVVDAKIADAIAAACDRLIAGEMRDQFSGRVPNAKGKGVRACADDGTHAAAGLVTVRQFRHHALHHQSGWKDPAGPCRSRHAREGGANATLRFRRRSDPGQHVMR